MKQHPLAALCQRVLATIAVRSFNPTEVISVPLAPDECREERADRLRQWCWENCQGQWRPAARWTSGAVEIEFEFANDAKRFRRFAAGSALIN